MKLPAYALLLASLAVPTLWADGPSDNLPDKVRRQPPAGIPLAETDRAELTAATAKLGEELAAVAKELEGKPTLLARLPDVRVLHKSVDWALRYDEFFRTNEVKAAREQLALGQDRLAALRAGQAPWHSATGLVVRGYVSRIDGSVQPYGLVVPPAYTAHSGRRWRLDFWFHGRGEQLTELAFVQDRLKNPGEFTPPDTFVLHLYGRYCNGSRFAGETDFWEALADVQKHYPIDEDRMVVRGFSLGGAACWHMATHHAWRWAAAAPGAGFSETAEFLNVFQQEKLQPFPWEQKLWRLYDSTSHALNVRMVPLVAYSGADDGQIQAARAMEKALATENLELTHLIGPKTGHRYEPNTKQELNRRIDALAAKGRTRVPAQVHFVTHTLRYPKMAWVELDGLGQHWEPARVDAALVNQGVQVNPTNVTAFTLAFGPGEAPFDPTRPVSVVFGNQILFAGKVGSDGSWRASFVRQPDGAWQVGGLATDELRKRPGLQGPIDDAFQDRFLMVLPTGTALNDRVGAWVKSESTRAIEHWRRHFRGDAPTKPDTDVTDAEIADANLVLWGDPQSNRVLARIADKLPIQWSAAGVVVKGQTYAAGTHVPVLVYPNPLNPKRYVVVNSGFTYREYDYLNNARQTPKLPDWAVVDLEQPVTSRYPGGLPAAGFFGERWELK
jgi:pimeloyl-ACP methyl ester carboxylesterase